MKIIVAQFVVLLWLCQVALGAYEPPNPAYNPPANYYNAATGTGTTLLNSLHGIVAAMTSVTYGDARYAFALTDADPNHSGNILLVYNNASVPGTWDVGVTFNREHLWPKYWLNLTSDQVSNTYSGPSSDLFELRPANPTVNSTRSNYPYGSINSNGVYGNGSFGTNSFAGDTYWYPSTQNAGEVARALFYMATRYSTYTDTSTGVSATHSLTLVNGNPTSRYTMGDLQSLLKWNYQYGVDNFERARNQAIYADSFFNPSINKTVGPQGNRNPFVDHPEYVWAVFGNSPNNSQISVATPTVNLGTILVGGALSTSNVTINKSGSTPTTYDVTTAGNATTAAAGVGQPFDYGTQSQSIAVGLNSSTSTPGLKTGTITIHNSDLTSAGVGQGSADSNDTINISATVLAHANATFNVSADTNTTTLNFGTIYVGGGAHTLGFTVGNLIAPSGYVAGLDLLSTSGMGNTSVLTTNLSPFSGLAAGSSQSYLATIGVAPVGTYSATYTLNLSDDVHLAGALGQQLTLNVSGTVSYLRGDFNIDGQITAADIPAMLKAIADLNNYKSTEGLDATSLMAVADVNHDGSITNADIQSLLDLVASQPGGGSAAAVPEPKNFILLVIGIALTVAMSLACRNRRPGS